MGEAFAVDTILWSDVSTDKKTCMHLMAHIFYFIRKDLHVQCNQISFQLCQNHVVDGKLFW